MLKLMLIYATSSNLCGSLVRERLLENMSLRGWLSYCRQSLLEGCCPDIYKVFEGYKFTKVGAQRAGVSSLLTIRICFFHQWSLYHFHGSCFHLLHSSFWNVSSPSGRILSSSMGCFGVILIFSSIHIITPNL